MTTNSKSIADLEIGLHHWAATGYAVEFRFSQPDSDADTRLMRDGRAAAQFDFDRLRELAADPEQYGLALGSSLLGDPSIGGAFAQALKNAEARDVPLRVRLFIGPSAPELHSLHWETLRDPQDGSSLLTNEHILFSRYLSSMDWRPVHLRSKAELKALVVISNPSDLANYAPDGRPLPPIDVAGELDRARTFIKDIQITELASGGAATLARIVDKLREGFDILYLVAHGSMLDYEPLLWLEDDSGRVAHVSGADLVTRLNELDQRPRLVILASCQSAGSDPGVAIREGNTRAALGPRLAEAGIPTVLAMQGNVSMATIALFMPAFFTELQRDGQIDRAVAVARGTIRERPDYWSPALFMRLKSGRIWYERGFADDATGFTKWPALLGNICDFCCTPILGSGLLESLIGSTRDLARRWADTYGFPMAPHEREDLPEVAQYLAITQQWRMPRRELANYLRLELLERYGANLPSDLKDAPLSRIMAAAADYARKNNPFEPHKILASLPFRIYLTTNPDNLLPDALAAAGKQPQVELCRWNEDLEWPPSIYDANPNYLPTVQQPLVYQLFGSIDMPESVVLSEDDYFDYLIGVTGNKERIPAIIRRALTDSALLFLGFRMDDWDFRALFRSLVNRSGSSRRQRYANVAAQINPEEDRMLDADGARTYLQNYFQQSEVSIYWGSLQDFVQDLQSEWAGYKCVS